MNLKPLGDRVVIKQVEVEEKTASGLVLPSSAKEQPQIAEVIAISPEILADEKKKDLIKVGDKVVYAKFSGTEVEIDGEKVNIMKLSDLLAIVE